MSESIGLYPNVVIGCDDRRLVFTLLDSATHIILKAPVGAYTIRGNTITFLTDGYLVDEDKNKLVDSGIAYKLLREPEFMPDCISFAHKFRDDSVLNIIKRSLYTLTFVLDGIPSLPYMHYPFLRNTKRSLFSDSILEKERVIFYLSKFRHVKRIRLLSTDILNSDILFLEELEDRDVETIVDQNYYLTHLGEFGALSKSIRIIVYLEDLTRDDEIMCLQSQEKISVSFFYQIRCMDDLRRVAELDLPVTLYPATSASEELVHSMLDYSVEELLQTTMRKQYLLLKNSVNPLFYGSIIVDNNGDLQSFPSADDNNNCEFKEVIRQLKHNVWWRMKRSDYFEKCRNCALMSLCPPLSSFEVNLRQTFCRDNINSEI